jgi:hypothetical protein
MQFFGDLRWNVQLQYLELYVMPGPGLWKAVGVESQKTNVKLMR